MKFLKILSIFVIALVAFSYYVGSQKARLSPPNKANIKNNVIYDYSYEPLLESPNKNWVGKNLKISFDSQGGRSIANKTKIVKVLSYQKDNEGFEYFKVKDISHNYVNELYFFWFENRGGPSIKYYEEAIKK